MDWKVIRLILICITVASGIWRQLNGVEEGTLNMAHDELVKSIAIILLAFPLMFQVMIGIQTINPKSDKVWVKPTWKSNPFRLGQPLNFFHFGATIFVTHGLAGLILGIILGQTLWSPILVLTVGIAAYVAIKLSTVLFRFKFVR